MRRTVATGALLAASATLMAVTTSAAAAGTTYRCEADGKVTYGDKPCAAGRQTAVDTADPVDANDRAAAAERRRHDDAQLSQYDRDRERERQQDLRALALARRRDADNAKHVNACVKLARRARAAHDAFDLAGPADQPKDRLKMQRADEDYAALCKH